jgi:hypothetical protein
MKDINRMYQASPYLHFVPRNIDNHIHLSVCYVLTNNTIVSTSCFQKCDTNLGHRCLCSGLPKIFNRLLYILSKPSVVER